MNELENVKPAPLAVADPVTTLMGILTDPDSLAKIDVDKVRELRELVKEAQAERARLAFNRDFHAAQAELSPIRKAGHNTQTRSRYPVLEDVESMLLPILERHGFTASVSSEPHERPDYQTIVYLLRHSGGHCERHALPAPSDHEGPKGSPVKTKLHGMASSLTYCRRILQCNVWMIQYAADDDGNAAGNVGPASESIDAGQLAAIKEAAAGLTIDWDRLYSYFGIAELSDLPRGRYAEAMQMLAKRRATIAAAKSTKANGSTRPMDHFEQ